MFRWEKLGKVFSPQAVEGRSWLKEFAQAPATLVFDDFVRVYFSCRPAADANGQYVSYSAFVDLDRADLFKIRRVAERPILRLGGLGEFDEFGTYPVSVIRDGDEVRAYYGGWTRCESVPFNVAIGCAISRDQGKSFRKLGTGSGARLQPRRALRPERTEDPALRRPLVPLVHRRAQVEVVRRQGGTGLQDPNGDVRRRHSLDPREQGPDREPP